MRYFICLLLAVVTLSSGLSCRLEELTVNNFTAQNYGISVNVPDGWAATEGPELLLFPDTEGLISFNSWGKDGFWVYANVIKRPESTSVSMTPDYIASRIPSGGAYIVLIATYGPPEPIGNTPDEYSRNDLKDLYTEHDWHQDDFPRVYIKEFYKAKTHLMLIIACKKDASDATVAQLNALLKSWRFVDFKVDNSQ
jgi:hypothetical protein